MALTEKLKRHIEFGMALPADEKAEMLALLELLSALPTENVASPAIWNDGGVLKVGSA